jgi:hypothetical protein
VILIIAKVLIVYIRHWTTGCTVPTSLATCNLAASPELVSFNAFAIRLIALACAAALISTALASPSAYSLMHAL